MSDVSAGQAASATAAPLLARYTSLRLGGPAGHLHTATDAEEIMQSVRAADLVGRPALLLGGGSNVVVADGGFPGTVILIRSHGVRAVGSGSDSAGETVTVRVEAGSDWDEVVATAVAQGWSGLECLSGIPGAAGATPIQNVGAYGQEVSETISAVRVLDRHRGAVARMSPAQCGFGYRTSIFKRNDRWVVLSVDFRLRRGAESAPIRYPELARALEVPVGARAPLPEVRAAVLELRRGKGMVLDPADPDTYSAGSFFTNPVLDAADWEAFRARHQAHPPAWQVEGGAVKVSAAWLIEQAGFARGYGNGGAGISTKHSLALTNRGDASTGALLAVAREIRDGVRERFGVTLRPEPVLVGCDL